MEGTRGPGGRRGRGKMGLRKDQQFFFLGKDIDREGGERGGGGESSIF